MPERTRVKLEGFEELAKALQRLPKNIAKNTARKALREVAEPLGQDMENRVARSTVPPHIAEAIVIKTKRPKSTTGTFFSPPQLAVGIAIGPIRRFFYGFFLEKGTSEMSAQPWARPAFDSWHPNALSELRESLWTLVEKAARRVARKKARASR